jgi:hypothetical protein
MAQTKKHRQKRKIMNEKLLIPVENDEHLTSEIEAIEGFELDELNDDEYLGASRAFADEYKGILSGQVDTEFQRKVLEEVSTELAPITERLEQLDEEELPRYLVQGYRDSLDKLYERFGREAPFAHEDVNDEVLAHVKHISKGPYGIPIIYTDGFNDILFGDDTLSFAATELMLENGLPPAVVVFDGYNAKEKEQVTTHETSHAVFTLLRRAGVIPSPEGEGVTLAGKESAFELARDEAIAQLAAEQNGIEHPSVGQRMKQQGYDNQAFEEYDSAKIAFKRETAHRAGLNFSDAILGVMLSNNFTELNTHMIRMGKIAEASSKETVDIGVTLHNDNKSDWVL